MFYLYIPQWLIIRSRTKRWLELLERIESSAAATDGTVVSSEDAAALFALVVHIIVLDDVLAALAPHKNAASELIN